MIKTNDLKKGAIVYLHNGWKAVIADNMRGNTRMATVYGFETEMGSIYSHDIAYAVIDGKRVNIDYTPAQLKLRQMVAALGM